MTVCRGRGEVHGDFLISPAITLAMWQVHQFPLCPFSRKVRLVLADKGVAHELVRELPWQRRDEFVVLNPAVQTQVVRSEERRVGKECVITCRSRGSPSH